MHGGARTGPRAAEGLERSRRPRWKHGQCSAAALAEQKRVRELLAQSRELLKQMQDG
jgi:IS5 family transposase